VSASPLFRLRFADGHEVELRGDALVWVVGRSPASDGRRRVSELKAGDRVALAGAAPDAPLRLLESVERLPRGRAGGGGRRRESGR
jgi:hypothetical protein